MTAAYIAVCLIWGSTCPAISLAVRSIPPVFMKGIRGSAAGLLLLMLASARGDRAEPRHWGHAALAGQSRHLQQGAHADA